jgi:hypothetical protein
MISNNSHKKIFLFCLESFNFQIKSFSIDTENIQNSLLLITNRIYCDYYKLFKLISSLFDDYKIVLPTAIKIRPIYNDLNPFAEYKIDDVCILHEDVCLLISNLISFNISNQIEIDAYTSKSQTGICILNFIKTLEYDNSILKDQIILYLNYMDFFKNTQTKHLMKLLRKMEALKNEIDEEIDDEILVDNVIELVMSKNEVSAVVNVVSLESETIEIERRYTSSSDNLSEMSIDNDKKNETNMVETERKKKGRPKKEDSKEGKIKASKKDDSGLANVIMTITDDKN